jgi:ADP-heptose:LPS heptosyltransferase
MISGDIDFREIKHVCISRTDAIGDVILTLPLAGYFKKFNPSVKITFLCSSYTEDVVRCSEHVDKILTTNNIASLVNETLPDAVVHAFPDFKLARFFYKAGVFFRIGTSHRWFHWILCNRKVNFSRKNSPLHESQLNFYLLRPFGFHIPDKGNISEYYGFRLPSDYQVPEQIQKQIVGPYIILHPKSKGSAREWKEENFINLAEKLHKAGYQVLVCGTEKEQQQVAQLHHSPYITNLMGQLNLREYIALISGARGLVAASTGPLHIAAMAGIKSAGLYPSVRPMHAGRWAPIGHKAKAFFYEKEEGCLRCLKTNFCECINKISVEEIFHYFES